MPPCLLVSVPSRGGNSSTRTSAKTLQVTGASGNDIGTAHVPEAPILKPKDIKVDASGYAKTDSGDLHGFTVWLPCMTEAAFHVGGNGGQLLGVRAGCWRCYA